MGLGSQTQLGGESQALVRNAKKSRKIWAKHPRVRTRFRTRGFVPGRITEGRSPAPRSGAIKSCKLLCKGSELMSRGAKNRGSNPGFEPLIFCGFVPGRITEGRSPAPRSGAIKFPSCFTRAPNPCREWAKNRDRTPGSNPYFFAVGEIFSRAQGERKVSSAA